MARKTAANEPPAKARTESDAIVERIVALVDADASCWHREYRLAKVRHEWGKWVADNADDDEADAVARELNDRYADEEGGPMVSVEDWRENDKARLRELIEQQQDVAAHRDLARQSLDLAKQRVKAANAEIEEANSRMVMLARELKKPYAYPLLSVPDRQRSLLVDDGEEWRLVKLSSVLANHAALQAVARDKLGDIDLGAFAEEAARWATVDKPKKLTRKQWDDIGEIVQEWHAEHGSDADGESADA